MTSPEERIELVRRAFQAFDAEDIEALLGLLHPDIEIVSSGELMNAGTFYGRGGYRRWMEEWREAWEDLQSHPEEIVPVGERHVVARVRSRGRGRGSGVEVSMEVGWAFEARDDSCVFMSLQPSFDAALRLARDREGIPVGANGD
jgi:ketosteroid isomerase-like protein